MLIRPIDLVVGYPDGRENPRRAWKSFNGSTPGALHRDPMWVDSRDPVAWARGRAEGYLQVFKLRERSCRRWQLKFCNQFYELSAARHAPRVSLPASKPGRPQVGAYCTAIAVFCTRCLEGAAAEKFPVPFGRARYLSRGFSRSLSAPCRRFVRQSEGWMINVMNPLVINK